jgi:hypothetical protein
MSKCTAFGSPHVAIAYLRASKNEQLLSREAQRAAIEAWAIREGARVAAWCTDHRLAAIIAPPRDPLVRFAGVLAPRTSRCGSTSGGSIRRSKVPTRRSARTCARIAAWKIPGLEA